MNPETVLPFLRQNGIDSLTVRILHPSRYRAIDLSFAEYCPWTPLDRMSPRRRAVHTPSPCLRHRNRREDIVELERIISKTCALGEGLRSKLKSAMYVHIVVRQHLAVLSVSLSVSHSRFTLFDMLLVYQVILQRKARGIRSSPEHCRPTNVSR